MRFEPAPLEDWLREYYFQSRLDLGSSGVQRWSMAELRGRLALSLDELDALVLDDVPSFGSAALRTAVAERWGRGDPDEVIVTHGSTEAIHLAIASIVEAGDEVVVVEPVYHALHAVARAQGAVIREWTLPPERGFAPDLDELRGMVTDRTRMVIVNFPHNPTGATLTRPQVEELVDICASAGAWLLWDGAFTELTYDRPPLADPFAAYPRCVSLGTLSKAYGLPGLRLGWCLARPDVLHRMLPLRDRLTLCLSPLTEHVALRVVAGADGLLESRRKQANDNLQLLAGWMAAHADAVDWAPPGGGVTVFPRLRVADVDAFCHRLARVHGVLLVPGSCFGHADRVRLGFGGPPAAFEEGLHRIGRELARP